MSGDTIRSWTTLAEPTSLPGRLDLAPVVLRVVAALLLTPSAVLKVVDYGGRAAFFAGIGVPAPGITVLLVALVELVSSALLVTGVEARAGALAALPVMIVAIALVGPTATNVAVLVACIGIVVLGPGRYTLRSVEKDLVQRAAE